MAKLFDQLAKAGALERFLDVGFVTSFFSFVIYLDLVLANFYGTNLHSLDYAWGDRIPIGDSLLLLTGFGLGSIFLAHWIRLPVAFTIYCWKEWAHESPRRAELARRSKKEREEREQSFFSERELLRMALLENNSTALKLRDDLFDSVASQDRERLRLIWAGTLFSLLTFFGSQTAIMNVTTMDPLTKQGIVGFLAFAFLCAGGQPKSDYGPRYYIPYPDEKLKKRPEFGASSAKKEEREKPQAVED